MKKAAVPSILVVVVLLALGVIAQAQQPKKVPLIGFLGGPSLVFINLLRTRSDEDYANSVTLRDKVSPLNGDLLTE
jgi:uroporphyrinogen-III decarboxylase